jgi:eukaryotic-like serine/threonine-protein kinase
MAVMTGPSLHGATIGHYVVRHEIGGGGMGTVYLAEHTMLGRRAALKILLPEMSANQEMVKRFFNEARAASAIKNPGIVEIYDFGYHTDGSAYIVMELLEGETLSQRLRRVRAMPPQQALAVARQIASALAPAHRAGIVHRDLKPDNIFLVPDSEAATGERAKVLDFGIAKLSGEGMGGGNTNLTSMQTVMGSPHYMSPEQCRGNSSTVDGRSDLYSLGCILYECLAGRPPFIGENFFELMAAHLHVSPTPLPQLVPSIPPEVDALVQRMLAKPSEQRLQTAEEVAQGLNQLVGQLGQRAAQPGGPQGQMQLAPGAATMHLAPGTPMPMSGGAPMSQVAPLPMQPMTTPRPMSLPGPAPTGSMPPTPSGPSAMPPMGYQAPPTPGPMQLPAHLQGQQTQPPGLSGSAVVHHPGHPSQPGYSIHPNHPSHVSGVGHVGHASQPGRAPDGVRRGGGRSIAVVAITAALLSSGVVATVMLTGEDEPAVVGQGEAPSTTPPSPPPSTTKPETAATVPSASAGADAGVDAGAATTVSDAGSPDAGPSPASTASDAGPIDGGAGSAATTADGSAGSGSAEKSRSRRKKVEPVLPVAPTLPDKLSAAAQAAGYDAVVSKIKACAAAKGVKGPLSVYVSIEVLPSGKVRQAQVTTGGSPALNQCVSSTLIHATFEPTVNGGTFRKIYVQE